MQSSCFHCTHFIQLSKTGVEVANKGLMPGTECVAAYSCPGSVDQVSAYLLYCSYVLIYSCHCISRSSSSQEVLSQG